MSFCFLTCSSSGSTKAAGMMGISTERNAQPEFFTLMPYASAMMPWQNSWMTARMKMDITQCQKLRCPMPGTVVPGSTTANPVSTVAGERRKRSTALRMEYEMRIMPINPTPAEM